MSKGSPEGDEFIRRRVALLSAEKRELLGRLLDDVGLV